jgi:hypothetical protein
MNADNHDAFYRFVNEQQRILAEAHALQGEVLARAVAALSRRIGSALRRVRERFHIGGTPHATAA